MLDDAAKSTRFDRTRGDGNVKLVAHNYNFVETRDARLVFQTQSSPTLPYLTSRSTNRPTKLVQHDGGDRLRKRRMVALLPRDDDQPIADYLSYRLIIVPWQEMGVKAVGTAAERGR